MRVFVIAGLAGPAVDPATDFFTVRLWQHHTPQALQRERSMP
jgi:hypothetical protein